jgi:hypothetical protein
MHRSFLFLGFVAASACVSLGACAAKDITKVAAGSVSAGPASSSGGAGGATDGGGMCDAPPPPSPTVPEQVGCYVDMGSGWVSVPCLCDLWIENTTPGPATAGIELTVTPPDQVPTLAGTLDVEIAFDDPDASWYAAWTTQAGNGDAFTVTSNGGTTTVKMGESSVALGPVPLAACETRKAVAKVSGSTSATLSTHAVLDDGTVFATTDGSCYDPPPP